MERKDLPVSMPPIWSGASPKGLPNEGSDGISEENWHQTGNLPQHHRDEPEQRVPNTGRQNNLHSTGKS